MDFYDYKDFYFDKVLGDLFLKENKISLFRDFYAYEKI